MNTESRKELVHLFDVRLQFTGTVEYGYTLAQSAAGVPIPELGARFDVFFEGNVHGARLNGQIKGVDYVNLSPDGVSSLHIHAHITTHDGCHIAVHSDGIARRRKGSVLADLNESMSFATADEPYLWINRLRGSGTGIVDSQSGQIDMTVTQES